jgi:hypothetical protein
MLGIALLYLTLWVNLIANTVQNDWIWAPEFLKSKSGISFFLPGCIARCLARRLARR